MTSGSVNAYHVYQLVRPIVFADLRLQALYKYFSKFPSVTGSEHTIHTELRMIPLYDGRDYSAARGMADAVYDVGTSKHVRGVCAISSRTDSDWGFNTSNHGDISDGLVVAIFGQPGITITDLQPVNSYSGFKEMSESLIP